MSKPNEWGFTPEQEDTADKDFHFELGNAIAAWNAIEYALFFWFRELAEISHAETARLIFYSTNGFRARAMMLETILDAPIRARMLVPKKIEFLKKSLPILRTYSAARNILAHGFTILVQNTNTIKIVADGDGTKSFLKEAYGVNISAADVGIKEIKAAGANWYNLKNALFGVLLSQGPKYGLRARTPMTPEEGLEQLVRLPMTAFSDQPRPTNEAKTPPPRSSPKGYHGLSKRQRRGARVQAAKAASARAKKK